jgi:HD-like signal output (HDOD) protein
LPQIEARMRRESARVRHEISSVAAFAKKGSSLFQKILTLPSIRKRDKVAIPMTKTEEPVANLLAVAKLPPFPSVALRLMHLIEQDTISFVEVGDLLKTDATLSVAVLRASNSPLFGARGEIKSIPLALVTLGLDRVSLLVLTTAMWRMVPGGLSQHAIRPWWRHNLATALLCKQLAGSDMVGEYCYMCGLLHSIGQLALLSAFPTQYASLLTETASGGKDLREAERSHFGVEHCELGSALLKKWNIPSEMVDAAAHHHDPEAASHPFTTIVNASCSIANYLGFAVAPRLNGPIEELPPFVQHLLNDEKLCVDITEKVQAMDGTAMPA